MKLREVMDKAKATKEPQVDVDYIYNDLKLLHEGFNVFGGDITASVPKSLVSALVEVFMDTYEGDPETDGNIFAYVCAAIHYQGMLYDEDVGDINISIEDGDITCKHPSLAVNLRWLIVDGGKLLSVDYLSRKGVALSEVFNFLEGTRIQAVGVPAADRLKGQEKFTELEQYLGVKLDFNAYANFRAYVQGFSMQTESDIRLFSLVLFMVYSKYKEFASDIYFHPDFKFKTANNTIRLVYGIRDDAFFGKVESLV